MSGLMWMYLILLSEKHEKLFGAKQDREQHKCFNNIWNIILLPMSQKKKKEKQIFSPTIMLFSQCPIRTLCWIIQYLFLFGCPFLSRECYLLFHFFKKELCLGGMHCHLLFCESNGGRDRAAEREWASGPVQWWPLWTEGIQTPRQDKVRGNWPAWSFPWEGGGTRPFIFSQGPRSLGYT